MTLECSDESRLVKFGIQNIERSCFLLRVRDKSVENEISEEKNAMLHYELNRACQNSGYIKKSAIFKSMQRKLSSTINELVVILLITLH